MKTPKQKEWNREYQRRPEVKLRRKERQKEYQSSTEGISKQRDSYLKRRYGISTEEYEILFSQQEGKCFICGTTWPGGNCKL
jgi:hypothetical protein